MQIVEKTVALYTMHELVVALDKPELAKKIVLGTHPKISKSPDGVVIKIKHDLDDNHIKLIKPIAEKRNLKIEKLDDALIIY